MLKYLRKSFPARISFINVALSFASLLIVTLFHLYYSYQEIKNNNIELLKNEITIHTAQIKSKIQELKNDVSFLSSTPPIHGIIRATSNKGLDLKGQSSIEQWKDRLAIIFHEMLIAKKNYTQIRYIGVNDKGRELVRVDRDGERIFRVIETKLQAKEDRPYFQESIKIPPRKVYLSPFSLNSEFGKIVIPHQMVLRAAVPIYDDYNKIFGIVVINMVASPLFQGLLDLKAYNKYVDIFNYSKNLLIQSKYNYEWENDKKLKVSEYPDFDIFIDNLKENSFYQYISNDKIIIGNKIHYNDIDRHQFIGVLMSTPLEFLQDKVYKNVYTQGLLMLILIMFILILSFYYIKKNIKPVIELKKLAGDLVLGNDVIRPSNIEEHSDELGDLTKSFFQMASDIKEQNLLLNFQKMALDEVALVSETDVNGRITYANKKFVEISGYRLDELLGSDHRMINSGFHSKEFFKELWETIKSGKSFRSEICNKTKDGQLYWVDSSIVPLKSSNEQIIKYISIRFDITDKKEQEVRLKELTDVKSKFLAVISHELRTPLSSIVGMSELLKETSLSKTQNEYLVTMNKNIEMLLSIINDILDLSKLDSNKVEFNKESANISDIFNDVYKLLIGKADEKKLNFNIDISPGVPQVINIDVLRLKQVLINLVSNAIKFTDHGSISMSVESEKIDDKKYMLKFSVDDTGIGIESHRISIIFNEFEQATSSTHQKYGGTGLGLAISKKIVEAMGGNIVVRSIPGQGSHFKFQIEVNESDSIAIESKEKFSVELLRHLQKQGLGILIADDNDTNLKIAKAYLKDLNYEVFTAKNGKEACDIYIKNNIDMVFLDIQMPIMDGLETCKVIKKISKVEKRKFTWIVALTSNVFKDDRDKYLDSGFNYFIGRPTRKIDLLKCIEAFIEKRNTIVNPLAAVKTRSIMDWDTLPFVNKEIINELKFLDLEQKKELWSVFIKNANLKHNEIEDAIKKDERSSLKKLLHYMMGSSQNIGLERCSMGYKELESNLDDMMNIEISVFFKKIKDAYNLSMPSLEKSLLTNLSEEKKASNE